MKFYYFGGSFEHGLISRLEESNFDGVMFTYVPHQGDIFTKIARDIKLTEKIKYLVAIRPYTISPQYLCMIGQSIDSIMSNRLQINLISGHIKENEKDFGGIVGEPNDLSDGVDRSNYLIDYIESIDQMKKNNIASANSLDFYVSTTNEYVLEATKKYHNKIIFPYQDYKNGRWTVWNEEHKRFQKGGPIDISNSNVMMALTPVIRRNEEKLNAVDRTHYAHDTAYFTHEQFHNLVQKLEKENVHGILMNPYPLSELQNLVQFIKNYTEKNLEIFKEKQ
jgi:hypothetical protein